MDTVFSGSKVRMNKNMMPSSIIHKFFNEKNVYILQFLQLYLI